MEQLVNDLILFLKQQNETFLYFFLFLSAVVENLFPPIPGDTITAFGAFLVGIKKLNYGLVYAATTIGSVIVFMTLFSIGRYFDRQFFIKRNISFFNEEMIIKAENWFKKFGYFIVLGNRFLPGIRSVISIVSGMLKLKTWKVLVLSLISASIWNLIWIHIGYTLGDNWKIVQKKITIIIQRYNLIAGIIVAVIIIGFIIVKVMKKKPTMSQQDMK